MPQGTEQILSSSSTNVKSGLIRRRSLLFPLVGLLIMTVVSTMGVGYFINYPFLYQSLYNKANIENEAEAAQIGFLLEHESNALIQLAMVVSRDGELQEAITYYTQDLFRLMRKILFFAENMQGINFVSVVDPNGKTIYGSHDSKSHFPQEAIQKTLKGNSQLSIANIDKKWAILAMAPIMVQTDTAGVLVLGLWINKDLALRLTPKNSRGIAFVAPDKTMNSSFDLQAWPPIDPIHIQTCLTNHAKPITILDEESQRGLYYSHIQILENSPFCLIFPLDLSSIHQTLSDHTQRLAWSSIIIMFMILLLGLTTHYLILQPLHRLRNKALILVEVCSNEKLQMPALINTKEGNEIQILDHAFETASSAIYAYISELNHQKEHFEDMSLKDPLTGLGNRRIFNQLVEKSIAYCHRYKRSMAIMYLDLDHFKPINDTLGHDIGDLLLKEVSIRLKQALRDTDVVFRLGGDEFAALLPECLGGDVALLLGKRLIQDVARPYFLNGHNCTIGVSVGIALFPNHANSIEDLLKNADLALYAAKNSGRGICRLFNEITPSSGNT